MMRPLDVVILSWNRPTTTAETVLNVLAQRGVDPRVWIVDQGSTCENLRLLRRLATEHSNVHLVDLDHNAGVPGGRNIGMKLGEAEYIVSIDNDAVFESPDALNRVVARFEDEPRIGAIGFRIRNYYTMQDDELSWVYPKSLQAVRDQEFLATTFCGAGHALRRSVVEEARGYDASLFFCWEEVDLSYRIINLGYAIVYDPAVVVLHKVAPEGRRSWDNERFYFFVRNTIYVRFKYRQSIAEISVVALAYIVKGFYNSVGGQAIRGVVDAVGMCYRAWPGLRKQPLRLGERARVYIWEHETRHRGNLWNRLRKEVLANLPGQG